MGLFKRRQAESFGTFYAEMGQPQSILTAADNPLGENFAWPEIHSAKELTRWLIACQTKQYQETIVKQLAQGILIAHAKLLMKQYSMELLVRATLFAAQVSPRPFSFKFVAERAIPEVLSRCPFLRTKAKLLPDTTKKRSARR